MATAGSVTGPGTTGYTASPAISPKGSFGEGARRAHVSLKENPAIATAYPRPTLRDGSDLTSTHFETSGARAV